LERSTLPAAGMLPSQQTISKEAAATICCAIWSLAFGNDS
jgi:hypothetical protein